MTEEQEKQLALMRSISDHQEYRENYLRIPFSYPGSKYESLDKILPLLPYANSYIEVFGGSGVVMLNRRASNLDVYNDIYSGVTSFFRTVRNPDYLQKLVERIALSPHGREEFQWSRDTWKTVEEDIERAARWYISMQSSFAGRGRYFGRVVRGKGSMWTKIQNNLDLFSDVAQRFLTVQIEGLAWKTCFEDYDSLDTVFYCDPPYVGHNLYESNMSKADHLEMCNRIFNMKGYVAVSSYKNDIYDKFPWDSIHTWEVKDQMTTAAKTTKTSAVYGLDNVTRGTQTEVLYVKEAEE